MSRGVTWPLALALAFALGALDQYLGTVRFLVEFGTWPVTLSYLSATWLIVPFLAGWACRRPREAALMGFAVTNAALLGFFLMTVSPFEGVPLATAPDALAALIASNMIWVTGGLVTGPGYGWLGYRWRIDRWPVSAGFVVGALCLEPLARELVGRLDGAMVVWRVEVAAGIVAAVAFCAVIASRRGSPLGA